MYKVKPKSRPVFLDLKILIKSLPLPGIVSILHRVTGVGLFLLLPVLLALLNGSLSSGENFEHYKTWADNALFKLILVGVLWAFLHHLLAGIRFLLIDAHIGVDLIVARKTARFVLITEVVLTVILGVALW